MDARSERVAKRFEPWLIVVTLLVVPVLILQGSDVGEPWDTVATVGDWTIWLAFFAELVVMLAIVPNRRHWLGQHPLDAAIVILTPPFATALLQSVRVLRLFRLVRLMRLASLGRSVFSCTGVRYAALLAALTAIAGAQAFAAAENASTTRPRTSPPTPESTRSVAASTWNSVDLPRAGRPLSAARARAQSPVSRRGNRSAGLRASPARRRAISSAQ